MRELRNSSLFPSGGWTGFYIETRPGWGLGEHRQDLNLDFNSGRITGGGIDDIGRFSIFGRYDDETGKCNWLKSYPGHSVSYTGFNDNGKFVWGTWETDDYRRDRGGFKIWPKQIEEKESAESEEQTGDELTLSELGVLELTV